MAQGGARPVGRSRTKLEDSENPGMARVFGHDGCGEHGQISANDVQNQKTARRAQKPEFSAAFGTAKKPGKSRARSGSPAIPAQVAQMNFKAATIPGHSILKASKPAPTKGLRGSGQTSPPLQPWPS